MMSDSSTARQLKPLKKKTQSDQVVEVLKEYIQQEDIQIGDRLPPELTMAKMLNVSRSTIREAIRTLSVLGIIEIVNGRGSYLKRKEMEIPINDIMAWFDNRKMELIDFIEVRKMIEPQAIELAIIRGSKDEFKKLDEIRIRYEEAWEKKDNTALAESDSAFHHAFIKMAHNFVLENIYTVLEEAFKGYRLHSFSVPYHAGNAIEPHRKINDAVQNRDIKKAKEFLIEHLEMVYTDMSFHNS